MSVIRPADTQAKIGEAPFPLQQTGVVAYGQRKVMCAADAGLALWHTAPFEERDRAAGASSSIAVIQVICAWVVKVHRLLDEV